jgi:hypothetical protein
MLTQTSPEFAEIWNTLADAEGLVNSYKSNLIKDIQSANILVKNGLEINVAQAIYDGNEQNKIWPDVELQNNYHLSAEQIKAYKIARTAQDRILEQRLLVKIYPLIQKLQTHIPNSGGYNEILDQIHKLEGYYQGLKNRGYVSTQRLGKIAVYAEDPAFPVGDVQRKLYTHVDSVKEAEATLAQWRNKYNAESPNYYQIKNLSQSLRFLSDKVTPATFESLVEASGADANDAEIVKLRDEVYQKFPSSTYELKRDFTRGYEKSWKNLLVTMTHQNEVYGNNYYTKIGGEEAKAALARTNLAQTDVNLYNIATSYIKDSITPYENTWLNKSSAQLRSKVYFMQLGYRFWQFVNNGITQPAQQTYSYFSRIGLEGVEPEKYFTQGLKLSKEILKEGIGKTSTSLPQEFRDIYQRLKDEHLVTQEFSRSLLNTELNKTPLDVEREVGLRKRPLVQKLTKEWPSIFQEAGEKTTRTITASEAYLVGTEKFNLAGEELYKFIRTAIVATQGAFGKGENPYVVRKAGEVGKLFYQFSSYNQMWIENLALAIKSDKQLKRFVATPRHIMPILITAGVKGLPLYAFGRTLFTLLTGKDPEEELKKHLKNHQLLQNFALYGVSGNASVSQKLGATIPIVDNFANIISDPTSELSFENIPAIGAALNFTKGIGDLATKGNRMRGVEEMSPAAIRDILRAARYKKEGAKDRGGNTIASKNKITKAQIAAQLIGISPQPLVEKYDEKRYETVKARGKSLRKLFSRISH